jgi:hypothetical protein
MVTTACDRCFLFLREAMREEVAGAGRVRVEWKKRGVHKAHRLGQGVGGLLEKAENHVVDE